MNTIVNSMIFYALIAIIAVILIFTIPVIKKSITNKRIIKEFNKLELNSKWIAKTNDTNPFKKHHEVIIITKEMGTDKKTPWIIYERTSGIRDTMKLEDFLKLYMPL